MARPLKISKTRLKKELAGMRMERIAIRKRIVAEKDFKKHFPGDKRAISDKDIEALKDKARALTAKMAPMYARVWQLENRDKMLKYQKYYYRLNKEAHDQV